MVWVPNKVALIPSGRYEEATLGSDAYPGMVLVRSGANVIPHNVVGGPTPLLIAIEDALRGADITQKLTSGDAAPFYHAASGGLFAMLLKNGQNVVANAPLMSGGDGTLIAAPASGNKLYQIVAPSTTIANTTVETTFSNGSFVIPANTLAVGDVIHIRAKAFQISVNATPTEQIKVYLGSTAIGDSGAVSVIAADVLILDIFLTIRTIGASGTYIGTAFLSSSASGTFTDKGYTLASTAIDTTAAQTITVKGTASAAHANNQTRLDEMTVEQNKSGGMNVLCYAQEACDNSAGTGTSGFNTAKIVRCLVP